VDEIHTRLLDMISMGRLPLGTKLHQNRLAEELGVSRTPIREALLRLEREGMVYTQPGRGMFVKGVQRAEIRELYEARGTVEPVVARMACGRASAKDVAAVVAIQERHEATYPTDVAQAFRSNLELHTQLVRPCGNKPLLRFLEGIWHQDAAFRIFAFYARDPEMTVGMVQEHRLIVDAFRAADGGAVEKLLERHIRAAYEVLAKQLDEMQQEGVI
jgi:DNA-binding GntR family transcriptional regulator